MSCWQTCRRPGGSNYTPKNSSCTFIPLVRHGKRMVRPYRWIKEAPYDPEQEPGALEVVHRAMDFGMLDGLVIPVASPTNRVGHVWIGGQTLDLAALDSASPPSLALLCLRPSAPAASQNPNEKRNLTPREREVLMWVALERPPGRSEKFSRSARELFIIMSRMSFENSMP